jgi:predicted nucleic acid-binding protein
MSAAVRVTLDTNILVYAIDESEGPKHTLSTRLVLRAAASKQPLMLQSLNELAAVSRQKKLMPSANIKRMVEFHRDSFVIEPPNADDLLNAIQASEDHKLSFWDALLWATARRSRCSIILSEDFQHERELSGVRFLNPFLLTPKELRALPF